MSRIRLYLSVTFFLASSLLHGQPVFFGLTGGGGTADGGVIFSYNASTGLYTKHHDFISSSGYAPIGGIAKGREGVLYGMTSSGGDFGNGVIFSFDPATKVYAALYHFNSSDPNLPGGAPEGTLLAADDGRLYGIANGGIYRFGLLFSFDPVTKSFLPLHHFNGLDGAIIPFGKLVEGNDGKIYGTMGGGGLGGPIYGTIFSYDRSNAVFKTEHTFSEEDGGVPRPGLMKDIDGKLYGVTEVGGENGAGVIYVFDPAGAGFSKLLDFEVRDGQCTGTLLRGSSGEFYGLCSEKGGFTSPDYKGQVFSFNPLNRALTRKFIFDGSGIIIGQNPRGSLALASDGKFYGMTSNGGNGNPPRTFGTIFTFDSDTEMVDFVHLFGDNSGLTLDGSFPNFSELIEVGSCTAEICDGIDNDCDGEIDENVQRTFWLDGDGDGFGTSANPVLACTAPSGYVSNDGDCNDGNAAIFPGATELCDGIDNDCDGEVDEGCANLVLPRITVSNISVTEGDAGTKEAVFRLSLNRRPAVPVTVRYATADLSANAPLDYAYKEGTVTFPVNSRSQTVSVTIVGDDLDEEVERFSLLLSSPVNATIGTSSATCTIRDNDEVPGMQALDATVSEGSAAVSVQVVLTKVSGRVVSVRVDTRNGSAKAPADYASVVNQRLIFQPGEIEKRISIPIQQDNLDEGTENFRVRLSDADHTALSAGRGGRREATVTILGAPLSATSKHTSAQLLIDTEINNDKFQVRVLPNPSYTNFRLHIAGDRNVATFLRIVDMSGRLVEQKYLAPGTVQAEIGDKWRAGIYALEVRQGNRRKVLQLVKL